MSYIDDEEIKIGNNQDEEDELDLDDTLIDSFEEDLFDDEADEFAAGEDQE